MMWTPWWLVMPCLSCSYCRLTNVSMRFFKPPVALKFCLEVSVQNSCISLLLVGMCFMLSTYKQWMTYSLSFTFLLNAMVEDMDTLTFLRAG